MEHQTKSLLSTSSRVPISVLIFEDDKALLELLLEICKQKNIPALGFHAFQDMVIPSNFSYSLVLTDINLPKVDGFEILRKLKSETYTHYKNQPIIAMTGQRNIERLEYLEAGFSEVLPKPFSADTLLETFKAISSGDTPQTNKISKTRVTSTQPLFNLEPISSFVENQEALESVLATFLQNTSQNLDLLEEALSQKDLKKVRHIAHQMLPMFRQLEVNKAIPILEQMEVISEKSNLRDIKRECKVLKGIFLTLEREVHERIFKHPVDTD